jgi:hypothetical protein
MLADWQLIKLVDPEKSKAPECPLSKIKVLSSKDKDTWELVQKYHVGRRKPETPTEAE